MSDPWLDAIESSLDNGDVPPYVTNKMILAALRIMDDKMDTQGAACQAQGVRIGLMERWQSKASGAIKAATLLGGSGLLITLLKIVGVF